MISKEKINELYETISKDLSIKRFKNESDQSYNCRLVYSALGKWIMTMFSDRDYENEDNGQVSKSHVTITAQNILGSYKKNDSSLKDYFGDDKKLVNLIEDVYVRVGYVNSGTYSFKKQNKKAKVRFSNRALDIDIDSKIKKMRGLGLWRKISDNDINLEDYLIVKEDSKEYAKHLLSQLEYAKFQQNIGKNEIYNIDKNRWELFSEKMANKYKYSIIKVDGGLDYQVVQSENGIFYSAHVPTIYTKKSNNFLFYHEIWRIILGVCALNGNNAKCYIISENEDYISIKFKGYILPALEESIFRCMCWPLNNCLNIFEFITDVRMKQSIIEFLTRLSIEVIEA